MEGLIDGKSYYSSGNHKPGEAYVRQLLVEIYQRYEPLYKDPKVCYNYLKDIRSI